LKKSIESSEKSAEALQKFVLSHNVKIVESIKGLQKKIFQKIAQLIKEKKEYEESLKKERKSIRQLIEELRR
jgi:hypothetical protein